MKSKITLLTTLLSYTYLWCQAGISISPGKLYFTLSEGKSDQQTIQITNPNDELLQVGISFSDWNYDILGSNQILKPNSLPNSCVDWIQVLPASILEIAPHETQKVTLVLNVPTTANQSFPVHQAMVFFTQLNSSQIKTNEGASILVTVRMGLKIYHTFTKKAESEIVIKDFKNFSDSKKEKFVALTLANSSSIWVDGKVEWELLNTSTGEKTQLSSTDFFTLPNDIREINQVLPKSLPKGKYSVYAQITYGDDNQIKIAELEIEL